MRILLILGNLSQYVCSREVPNSVKCLMVGIDLIATERLKHGNEPEAVTPLSSWD